MKNTQGFTLVEVFLVIAIIGVVAGLMPKMFIANSTMNHYFDVQTLINSTHGRVVHDLQNKDAVLGIMKNLYSADLVSCLQDLKPTNDCSRFNMSEPKQLQISDSILNSQLNLNSEVCTEKCLISVTTFYKTSCRVSSCDSIQFSIKIGKIPSDDPAMNQVIDSNDVVVLGKNHFRKNFAENMSCNVPGKSFLFSFNYLSRDGSCRDCGGGFGSCSSSSGGFRNAGVLKSNLTFSPDHLIAAGTPPDTVTLNYEIQQATNDLISRVDISCQTGNAGPLALPDSASSQVMQGLNQSNHAQGSWAIPIQNLRAGNSYSLTCTLKGYDSDANYIISFFSTSLPVYATQADYDAVVNGSGSGAFLMTGGSSGGFSAPSYSCP